jgi:phage gp46-like protein
MKKEFEGDILLIETPDGGDCVISDGLLNADGSFSTAVYISLFGGNKDDTGKVKNKNTWWGNTLRGTAASEKIVSRFQALTRAVPLTVKNIKDAEAAALLDLQWIKDEGIGDEIKATGTTEGKNRFRLAISISKAGETVFENGYGMLWEGGLNGGI